MPADDGFVVFGRIIAVKIGKRDLLAHAMRIVACLLLLAAASASMRGRVLGRELHSVRLSVASQPANAHLPSGEITAWRIRDIPPAKAATLLVLLAAAVVPLLTKSRRWRTVQLVADIAVLGLWSGAFLSTARLVGWAGSGLPGAPEDFAIAILLLGVAFLWPLFGRPSHYCLWICPFGAAQELAGRAPCRKWRLSPKTLTGLTLFRRLLWAALMLSLWCFDWSRWMGWELFGAFAWRAAPPILAGLAAAAIALSVFIPRAYCRFVCPTGTLLKLAEANQKDDNPK